MIGSGKTRALAILIVVDVFQTFTGLYSWAEERTADVCNDEGGSERLALLEKKVSSLRTRLQVVQGHIEQLKGEREWQESNSALVQLQYPGAEDDPAVRSLPAPPSDDRVCTNQEHLRLVNGSNSAEGRVEVMEGNQWKTVCEDNFSYKSAKLVCSMLGYPGSKVGAVGGRVFGDGNGMVLTASGACANSAGLICQGLDNYRVRLVNGSTPHDGRVEILINGQWGTFCDNNWDGNEASVVCRMLGYGNGRGLATANAMFGQGTGPVWSSGINCMGDEEHIMSCSQAGSQNVGYRGTCTHRDDAGVVCDDFLNYPVRLVNGNLPHEGNVEIRIDGQWTPIFDANWQDQEAAVVCRQLGYNGLGAKAVMDSHFGSPTSPQASLGYLNCQGHEHHLFECPMNYALNYQWNANNDAAGVICASCQ